MKIFRSLSSGALRSLKSWKGILIIWLFSLLMVSLFVIPMKGAVKAGFGNSTIIEKLQNGIDIEVILDLGEYFKNLISYFSSGIFFLLFLGILINSFLAGGLFNSLKGTSGKFSTPDFFRTSARYFWYFLGLYFTILIMILFMGFIVVGLPVGLLAQSENSTNSVLTIVGIISGILFLMIVVILFLVADYSRAWIVSAERPEFFKALGFGFSKTFSRFVSSFTMMLIIIIIQILYTWLLSTLLGIWKPVTGGGVFILFLGSQLLIIIKLFTKAWRYGSVTTLKEINENIITPNSPPGGAL